VSEAYNVLSDQQKRSRYDNGQDLEDHGMDMGGTSFVNIFTTKILKIMIGKKPFAIHPLSQ